MARAVKAETPDTVASSEFVWDRVSAGIRWHRAMEAGVGSHNRWQPWKTLLDHAQRLQRRGIVQRCETARLIEGIE